jgi:hypothetical protein
LVEGIQGWKPGRSRLSPQRCLTGSADRVADVAMLLLQRGDDWPQHFDNAGTCRTLGPTAARAPEAPWPNRPRGGSGRGLHPCVTHARPQGLPPLQELPVGALRLGHPTGLARCQPPLHVASDGPHLPGTGRVGQGPT